MPPETETAEPAAPEVTAPPTFHFRRFTVHRAVFDQSDPTPADEGETRPPRVPVNMVMQASAQIANEAAGAAVFLNVHLTPNQKWQPYRIEVTVSGTFVGQNCTREQFDLFCRKNAPTILFPYVRELVHRITGDAMFGSVLLDPVNMLALLAESEWTVAPTPETSAASEQPPPSSQ